MSTHDDEHREPDETSVLRTIFDDGAADDRPTRDGASAALHPTDSDDRDPEVGVDSNEYSDEDDLYLYETGSRLTRSTSVIAGLVAAAVLVLTGMQIQHHFGSAQTASASTGGAPAGLPTGGLGGIAAGGGGTSTTTGTSAQTPAVIGTVVSARDGQVIVKDIGGTKHTVDVAASLGIQRQSTIHTDQLKTGESVTVVGVTNLNGHIDATSITAR